MSHIAKSLQNINYGQDIASNIIGAINEQKQKEALNKYIGLMQQSQQQMNQAYQPQRKTVLGFKNSEVPIDTTQRNLTSLNNNQLPVTQAPTSNQMPSYQEQQPVDYNEANRQAINTVMDFINKSLPLQKDLPQGMTQQGLSALEMLRGANQPKPLLSEDIPSGGLRIYRDPVTGEVVRQISNPKEWDKSRVETETNEDGTPKIYNKGGKQYLKEITTDPTGHKSSTFKPVPNAPKTTINNPAPPPDISSNVKDLTNLQKDFQYWDSISKGKAKYYDSNTGSEVKNPDQGFIQSKKQAAWAQVVAETDATANKLNSKYPGFERIYNALFQNSDIKNKKDIDKAIDEDMQGAPKDAIVQMKRLIHARVF